MDTEQLPLLWQRIGLILAFVGTGLGLMALPTVFQMIWGKPHILLLKGCIDGKRVELLCYLTNVPLSRRVKGKRHTVLQALGVRTAQAEDVFAEFVIRNAQDRKIVLTDLPVIETYNVAKGQHICLPASTFPSSFRIAVADEALGAWGGLEVERLPTGLYEVEIIITVDGGKLKPVRWQFVVQDAHPRLYWVKEA